MRKMYEDGVGMVTDVMGMGWGREQMGRGWGWDGDGCDVMGMGWEWEWGETCGNGVGMGRTSCPVQLSIPCRPIEYTCQDSSTLFSLNRFIWLEVNY